MTSNSISFYTLHYKYILYAVLLRSVLGWRFFEERGSTSAKCMGVYFDLGLGYFLIESLWIHSAPCICKSISSKMV